MHKIWLILDTSCPRGVVALSDRNNVIISSYMSDSKQHGDVLSETVEYCLNKVRLKIKDIYAIAVGTGPGSFTGIRIGLAFSKGLAIATGIPLIGLNTFAGMNSNNCDFIALKAKNSNFYSWKIKENVFEIVNTPYSNTYLEIHGPSAENLAKLLPEKAYDETLNLVPNYIRSNW